ncbi:MAG: hypothetical protein MUF04_08610 [Akkermansiaceae bacterium]|nr:hypothetical protein [Akkermansiaceae bacterium]
MRLKGIGETVRHGVGEGKLQVPVRRGDGVGMFAAREGAGGGEDDNG